jgi:hypothetical protein
MLKYVLLNSAHLSLWERIKVREPLFDAMFNVGCPTFDLLCFSFHVLHLFLWERIKVRARSFASDVQR